MTSEERRRARYLRRRAARDAKRDLAVGKYDSLQSVGSMNALVIACRKSRLGVSWKASVQRYVMNRLKNASKTSGEIMRGDDVRRGFIKFDLVERGKLRHISSVHFSERVAQRSLCANALIPILTRSLIHDNGASLKGKGISFSVARLKTHLRKHYRRYGNEGYVLKIDFKDFFGSMSHEHIREIIESKITDKRLAKFAMGFVEAFGDGGLGLGSETSQILAIAYPNCLDHYIKEKLRIKGYGRYMDDLYLLHKSKGYLWKCLDEIRAIVKEMGLSINDRKTTLTKLSRGFVFLKSRFLLTDTGKVVVIPSRDSIVRQRRKLKAFKRFVRSGKMTVSQAYASYMSWRGYIKHKNSHQTVRNMDGFFEELFKRRVAV